MTETLQNVLSVLESQPHACLGHLLYLCLPLRLRSSETVGNKSNLAAQLVF
jgi:hypothetical protein